MPARRKLVEGSRRTNPRAVSDARDKRAKEARGTTVYERSARFSVFTSANAEEGKSEGSRDQRGGIDSV